MDYRLLGRTGLRVSPLCLGTMNFGMPNPLGGEGKQTEEDDAFGIMDRALELGINFFDTANGYGRPRGLTEEIIGRWFATGDRRRERVVLATKVYGARSEWPNDGRLSALHIRQACDDSLRRLQTDHIDLYQMHHVDRDTPWEEIWQAMDLLVAQGKVLYVGSSNFAAWHIVKANEAAARRHSLGLVSEQSLYNLNARTVELEVLPACADYGVGVLPWSPLAGGLLGGVLAKDDSGSRRGNERMRKHIERNRTMLEQWEKLCAQIGAPPADVALAWLLHNPAVTAPIIGPRTLQQLDGALGALDVELTDDVLLELDQIFPGPGGAAPEAYAW
jgi:aryl-alcohol dehydrogenase-like predicted oxidoreductase